MSRRIRSQEQPTTPIPPTRGERAWRAFRVAVEAAEPRATWYEVGGAPLRGFHARIGPNGHRLWCVRYRVGDGPSRRERLGDVDVLSLEDARTLAMERIVAATKHGRDMAGERRAARAKAKTDRVAAKLEAERKASAPTLAKLADEWLADPHGGRKKRALQPSTAKSYRELLDGLVIPAFGDRRLDEPDAITADEVETWHAKMERRNPERRTPGRANRALACLSALLTWAVKRRIRPRTAPNPCAGIEHFDGGSPGRFMTAEERQRLEVALASAERIELGFAGYVGAGVVLAVRLLTLTGMRAGEVTALEWRDVDLARGEIRLRVSKTGPRTFPIGPTTRRLLEAQRDADPRGTVVCPSECGTPLRNLRRAWVRLLKAAEIEGLRLHDLRHAYVSSAVAAGVPLDVVGARIGHASISTTKLYMHLRSDAVRRGAELAEAAIDSESQGADVIELRPAVAG